MAVSQGFPAEGEEEMGKEDIPCESEGNSLAHQSFEEALFGWPQVHKDSDKLVTSLTEEWWLHLTVSVIYTYLFYF